MKTILFFLTFITFFKSYCIEVNIKPEQFEKMNFFIAVTSNEGELHEIARKIKAYFEFSEQFKVEIIKIETISKKTDIAKLESPLILFLSLNFLRGKKFIQWRVYDSSQIKMLIGKQIFLDKQKYNFIARNIADQIWEILVGEKGCFSSVIAACKKTELNKKNSITIHLLHPIETYNNLSDPLLVVKEQSVCLLPRWNNSKPLLYYSKHTSNNVRLMSLDTNKNKSIVSNFDGLNLTPTFSDDNTIVMCLSINGKERLCKYNYDKAKKKGNFIPLTDKTHHAISPCFIDNDKIVFCLIDKLNKSRIAILNISNNEITYLTKYGQYCVCPNYNKKTNKVVYCKKTNGCMQIFTYDMTTKEHKQITHSKGDKDSCNWSQCGNYITCSVEADNSSRIAIINIKNNNIKYITPENENWSNPCWSPGYNFI